MAVGGWQGGGARPDLIEHAAALRNGGWQVTEIATTALVDTDWYNETCDWLRGGAVRLDRLADAEGWSLIGPPPKDPWDQLEDGIRSAPR